jgi:hypothetical protein
MRSKVLICLTHIETFCWFVCQPPWMLEECLSATNGFVSHHSNKKAFVAAASVVVDLAVPVEVAAEVPVAVAALRLPIRPAAAVSSPCEHLFSNGIDRLLRLKMGNKAKQCRVVSLGLGLDLAPFRARVLDLARVRENAPGITMAVAISAFTIIGQPMVVVVTLVVVVAVACVVGAATKGRFVHSVM